MNNIRDIDINLLKIQLQGSNFKKLLKAKKQKKYRIAKNCGISYRTLCNWQGGNTKPSDELALRIARYLGLIKPEKAEILDIERKQKELQERIDRLSK